MIKTINNKTVAVLLLAIALLFPSFLDNQNASASVIVISPWTVGHGGSDSTSIDAYKVLYEGNVFTNSATGSACPTTSFTKQTTSDNIFLGASGSSTFCRRGIYEFNLDGIPFDATITQVQFKYTVDAVTSGANCDYVSLNTNEPRLASASQVWTDIGANTVYVSNDSNCATTGVKTITLGSTANTNLQSALNSFSNSITTGWFAVGMKFNDETRQVGQRLITIGTTSGTDATRPQIIVSFTSNTNSILIGNSSSDVPQDGRSRKTVDTLNTACSGATPAYSRVSNTSPDFTQVVSQAGTACNVLYMQFNTAAINDASTSIGYTVLEGVVSSVSNGRNCDIKPTTTKPSTETDTNLYTNIQSSTAFVSNSVICATTGSKVLLLGSTANSNVLTNLANDWFAVGIPFTNQTRDLATSHDSTWRLTEDTVGQRPRINIQYTIASTYNDNIVTTDNTPTKSLDKTFSDTIVLSSDIVKSLEKSFNESINLASGGLIFDISKSFDESLNILDGSNLASVISGSFNEFVILMDNLETSTDDAGINWSMFAGLFVVIPMLILLPIVAIKRRRR